MNDVLVSIPITGVVTGGVALLSAYFAQRWAVEAAAVAEKRQARIQERRASLLRVSEFLDTAAQAAAYRSVKDSVAGIYDANLEDVQKTWTRERFEELMLRRLEKGPTLAQLHHALMRAATTVPTRKIQLQLLIVYAWTNEKGGGSAEKLRQAVQKLRGLIEEYIVDGPQHTDGPALGTSTAT